MAKSNVQSKFLFLIHFHAFFSFLSRPNDPGFNKVIYEVKKSY